MSDLGGISMSDLFILDGHRSTKTPSQENIGCLDTNPGTGSTDVLSKNCMDESTRALYHGQMVCGGNACPNAARLWDEVRKCGGDGGNGLIS